MLRRLAVLCAAVLAVLVVLPGSALAFNPEAMVDCDLWQKEDGTFRWAAQDIDDAISFEVFLGYPTGTHTFTWLGKEWTRPKGPEFRPGGEITRAEFATALARVLGLEGYSGPVEGFSDVKAEEWFGPYVGGLVSPPAGTTEFGLIVVAKGYRRSNGEWWQKMDNGGAIEVLACAKWGVRADCLAREEWRSKLLVLAQRGNRWHASAHDARRVGSGEGWRVGRAASLANERRLGLSVHVVTGGGG